MSDTPLPTRLLIGFQHVDVLLVDGLKAEDGDVVYGLSDPDNDRILLDSKLTRANMAETLIHEVLHVIYKNFGIDHANRKLAEEEVVTRVSQGLATVIAANPGFASYLRDALADNRLPNKTPPTSG